MSFGKNPRTINISPIIHAWDHQISIIFRCPRRKKRQSWRGDFRTIPSVEVGAEPASWAKVPKGEIINNHDDDDNMKSKWYLSISLNLCFVVCFLQILYFLWGWIQIYFFCRLYTFGFNYTFYISCEVGLKHTFLDTGWALTEALADLIESVLTAASVLTKMRMGQDTLKMISENSLDLLFCNIYTVVEKRTLTLLQCSLGPNYAICLFLSHRYWNLNPIPVKRYLIVINYKDISFYERHIYLPKFEEAGFVPP